MHISFFLFLICGGIPLDEISAQEILAVNTEHGVTCFAAQAYRAKHTDLYLFDHATRECRLVNDGRIAPSLSPGIFSFADGFMVAAGLKRQVYVFDPTGAFLDAVRFSEFSGFEGYQLLSFFYHADDTGLFARGKRDDQYATFHLDLVSLNLKEIVKVPENNFRSQVIPIGDRFLFFNESSGKISWLDKNLANERVIVPEKTVEQRKWKNKNLAKSLGLDSSKARIQNPLVGRDYVFFSEREKGKRRCLAVDLKNSTVTHSWLMPLGSLGDSHLVYNFDGEEVQWLKARTLDNLLMKKKN